MSYKGIISKFAIFLSLLLLCYCRNETTPRAAGILQRSTPEAEGVTSESIISFIKAVEASPHELHSFMFLRHGKVIAVPEEHETV